MWKRFKSELVFVWALVGINLASAMEYRAAFITQIVGMIVNNSIYFVFWLLFFDRFGAVRGYEMRDILLLFAIVTTAYGIAFSFAGNIAHHLAGLIAQGRLDYYLVLPRPLLTHLIFSRMVVSALGDLSFGLIAFLFAGRLAPLDIVLFVLTVCCAAVIFVGFAVTIGSLAFFMGNAQFTSQQMFMAVISFATYPNSLFSGGIRVLLFTLVPAGFVGAVPVMIVQQRNGLLLLALAGAAGLFALLAALVFYTGLRRYESGSAINVNV